MNYFCSEPGSTRHNSLLPLEWGQLSQDHPTADAAPGEQGREVTAKGNLCRGQLPRVEKLSWFQQTT